MQAKENMAQTRVAAIKAVKGRWVLSEGREDRANRIYQHSVRGGKKDRESKVIFKNNTK